MQGVWACWEKTSKEFLMSCVAEEKGEEKLEED